MSDCILCSNQLHFTFTPFLPHSLRLIYDIKNLIINLPGSPKAVEEALVYILPSLKHGLEIMLGLDAECARKD